MNMMVAMVALHGGDPDDADNDDADGGGDGDYDDNDGGDEATSLCPTLDMQLWSIITCRVVRLASSLPREPRGLRLSCRGAAVSRRGPGRLETG